MTDNDSIRKIAQYLYANNAPGSEESHIEFLENISTGLRNQAEHRGTHRTIVNAVFGYISNHHCYDLDSQEKTKTIIETVFQMACPMAADDNQSKQLLGYLKVSLENRENEL